MTGSLCGASPQSETFSPASRNRNCTQERCILPQKLHRENEALTLLAAPSVSMYGNSASQSSCGSSCSYWGLAHIEPESSPTDQAGFPSASRQANTPISKAKDRSAMGFVLLVVAMYLLLIGARWPRLGEVSQEDFPKSVCRDSLLCLLLGGLLLLAGRFLVES
jgi:hypothetical protein